MRTVRGGSAAHFGFSRAWRLLHRRFADHGLPRGLFFVLVVLALASQGLHGSSAVDNQSGGTPELVLRAGEGPLAVFGAVNFSPNGRLVAVETSQNLIVFDLTWNTEIRRIPLKSEIFMRRTVFPHHSQEVFVEDGDTILECRLEGKEQCKSLVDDAFRGGAFAVSEDDRWLAYLDHGSIPTLIDLRIPAIHIPVAGLNADGDDLARVWSLATFSSDSKLLGVVRGRRDALVFQIGSQLRFASRSRIPRNAFDLSFNSEQHLIACIPVPNEKASNASDSFQVFDITSGRQVGPKVNGAFPHLVRHGTAVAFGLNEDPNLWTRTEVRILMFSTGRTSILKHLPASINDVHVSPDARQVVYLESELNRTSTAGAILVQELEGKNPPSILIGATSRALNVDFLSGTDTLFAHDGGTRLWTLFSGTQTAVSDEIEFSADGKLGAYFPRGHKDEQELWTFAVRDLKPVASGSTLSRPQPPSDFVLSHDGRRLIWWEVEKLVIWDRVKKTRDELPCKSAGSLLSSAMPPQVSPSGLLVGAICYSPTSNNGKFFLAYPQLLVWNIDTLEKIGTIDANNFSDSFAFSPDDRFVALGGETIKIVRISDGDTFILGNPAEPLPPGTLVAYRKNTASLAFAYHEPALLAITEDSSKRPFSTMEVWDLITRTKKDVEQSSRITSIAISPRGLVAELLADGSIALSRSLREKPVARLIGVGDRDWLVVAENGLFDGSADAMKWVGWRLAIGSPVLSLDLFFDELYHPGLLSEITRGKIPELPSGLGVSVFLGIPGLRTMLRQDLVTPKISKEGRAVLCFHNKNAFTAVERLVGRGPGSSLRESEEADCPLVAMLPDSGDPESILKSVQDLKASHISTPWDNKVVPPTPNSTLHILTIAISQYPSGTELGPTPTAVAAAENLQNVLGRQNLPSKLFSEIKLWNQPEFCGKLADALATRSAMVNCLDKMATVVKPDDSVVLFLSGHGEVPENQEMFYFMPSDYRKDNARETGFSSAMLAEKLRSLAARRIVLIIDACQSGAVLDSLVRVAEARATLEAELQDAERSAGVAPHDHTMGIGLIAATMPLQVGGGSADSNAFEDALLEALQRKARTQDNEIRVSDLVRYIQESGSKPATKTDLSYTPLALLVGADFAIATDFQ
jgi:WD40 repeat protein